MYFKGANMLHTLRQIVNDDEKWRAILRGLNTTFYHQTVTTGQVENYLNDQISTDLKPFFDQYLRTVQIPKLEYRVNKNQLFYRWSDVVDNYNIPVKIAINDQSHWIVPTALWKKLRTKEKIEVVTVNENFYIVNEDVNIKN